MRNRQPLKAETKAKIGAFFRGRPLSAEHREKLRLSHLGHLPSPDQRKKQGRGGAQHWNWQGGLHSLNVHGNYTRARNARRLGAAGSHTEQEWLEKIELHAGRCIYCGEQKPLTRDHNVPLTRGGSDGIANILPACRSCNARKHTLTASEYMARKAA